MNRHAPLFRVAFVSLLMAIGLPLLVFAASQVRHRQLHSNANPRWKQFKDVNPTVAENSVGPAAVPESNPPHAPAKSSRLPALSITQSTGMTGSATGTLPQKSVDVPPKPITELVPPPSRLVPEQTAALPRATSVDVPVPVPDDLPPDDTPAAPPRTAFKPKVEFRTLSEAELTSRRIEAQLAGMQRRLDQLAQLQNDKPAPDLEGLLNMLQQAQQTQRSQLNQLNQQLTNSQLNNQLLNNQPASQPALPQPPAAHAVPDSGPALPAPNVAPNRNPAARDDRGGSTREPSIKIVQGEPGEDDERFSIQVQDASLTEVLEMLGQLSGVNILASRDVQGRVSLNLQDVTVEAALDAILKSQGFVFEREGNFIYVRSFAEATAIRQANRKIITKIYQLYHISASELQKLTDPLLTKGVGRQAVTSPSQVGIAPMSTSAGGDGLAGRDTLLVQDYPEVIAEIDKVVIELDVPPLQVLIEAKILSVVLSENMQFGVNFAVLNGAQNSQLLSGNGSTLNGAVGFPATGSLVPPAGDFIANTAGLKYGFIQGDVSGFIKALETIADTTLVAAPQLRVLNKQKAEMIIGERLSYKTLAFNGNQTVENVQFLDAGTKLIFRPFISPDGLVRLEVHPERSRATINETTGLPNSETTEVTTNVMVRDGTTVVLGGLISEESTESIDRVPVLGAIPLVGAAFRNKTARTQRNELIVLITPRIVTEPEDAIEGEKLQFETEERAAHFRDKLSIINRTTLTRAHYERACKYFEQGNLLKAKQQIDAALLQNKGDLECQRMKLRIDQALRDQQSRIWKWPMGGHKTVQR